MTRIKIIVTIALIALTVTLSGQKREKQTVVLVGGSRLAGTIIVDSADYLKLRITSPQILTLKKSEVLFSGTARKTKEQIARDHGYSISLSTSVLAGRNDEGNTRSFSFHLLNGYRFRNGLSAGFGAGFEELEVDLLPVYIDLRYYPLKSRLSPYIWTKSGWSFTFSDNDDQQSSYYRYYPETKGGYMFNAGTGIELASWRRNAVIIGIGYRYQKITFMQADYMDNPITKELVTRFNRIELQFGFIFR